MLPLLFSMALSAAPIDRQALVSRHNVVLTDYDGERPVQVGNGEFAFGMDITGMQTFVPFNTMSNWGWHSGPPPEDPKNFEGQVWETHGRPVRYPMPDPKRPGLSLWLASNPHRINLGRIGLILKKRNGATAEPSDLKQVRQSLNLWTGVVTSSFELDGKPVRVLTAAHPTKDTVAFRVVSPLMREGRLSVGVSAPGNSPLYMANFVGDWHNPAKLDLVTSRQGLAVLQRPLEQSTYHATLRWQGSATLKAPADSAIPLKIEKAEYGGGSGWLDVTEKVQAAVAGGKVRMRVGNSLGTDPAPGQPKHLRVTYLAGPHRQTATAKENEELLIDADPDRHRYRLEPSGDALSLSVTFSRKEEVAVPTSPATISDSEKAWPKYWESGAAIDLSGTADPRAKELERRVVLSQYLMAVNEAGSLPPQESGLVNNGWYGRFHFEMIWWHAAHWYLWNRADKAKQIVGIYARELERAKETARSQGYAGARWPKCIGPDGREWPHEIHALLLWQQPHPIFFAELEYRANPTRATIDKWMPIVEATADFMASYAFARDGRFVLGPPLHVVSENVNPRDVMNPAFELGYWRFGLRTAQTWRKRAGLNENSTWARVQKNLAPLPVEDGVYILHEGIRDMWTKYNFEHPALIGTYGMLPGDGVDVPTMRRTLAKVRETWNFSHVWGWDLPMLAMCAARLGQPSDAVDYLLHPAPTFQFDARGLATGGPFPYFPSNGGLLYAVAMMASGWDGSPKRPSPGFPVSWKVRVEGFRPAP